MSNCEHSHVCTVSTSNIHQTLDELEFERGIWSAAQSGDIEKVQKLLNNGENVNRTDNADYTALHYAARNGHLEICVLLLRNGANIDAVTRAGGATALHRACTSGKLNIVQLLLSKQANAELQDNDGKNTLHRAIESGHLEISKLLLEHFPNLKTQKDLKGKSPSDYAKSEYLSKICN